MFAALLKMRQSRACCAKTGKLQKGKRSRFEGARGWRRERLLRCVRLRTQAKHLDVSAAVASAATPHQV